MASNELSKGYIRYLARTDAQRRIELAGRTGDVADPYVPRLADRTKGKIRKRVGLVLGALLGAGILVGSFEKRGDELQKTPQKMADMLAIDFSQYPSLEACLKANPFLEQGFARYKDAEQFLQQSDDIDPVEKAEAEKLLTELKPYRDRYHAAVVYFNAEK